MDSPMIRATWQTGLLSAVSNVLGQFIKAYQANKPFIIDTSDLLNFILFSVLSCPPNFAWQAWMEQKFPGYTSDAESADSTAIDKKRSLSSKQQKKRNVRNVLIKFALDQTIGAAVNTIIFIATMDLLRGHSLDSAIQHCRTDFWPLMFAGYKMWPAVSIANFLLVPVEHRVVVGSIAGLFWGIYLSLLSSKA